MDAEVTRTCTCTCVFHNSTPANMDAVDQWPEEGIFRTMVTDVMLLSSMDKRMSKLVLLEVAQDQVI